ncbi:MAG: DUF4386 domain-containing protein [Dehalococcoidia bacterium]
MLQPALRGASPMVYARVAGVLYLFVFLVAPFAEFVVREGMIVAGNPAATAANIRGGEFLFRAGFASDLAVFAVEVVQAGVLFVLFAPVSRVLALVMAFGRLAQATAVGLNLLNQWIALLVLTGGEYLAAFDTAQREALALLFLEAQSYGYELGLVFFAVHLAALGWLVTRSTFLPRLLGALLAVSAAGYLLNSFVRFLWPEFEPVLAQVVIVTALIGELPLTVWLLWRGVDVDRWRERAAAPAVGVAS